MQESRAEYIADSAGIAAFADAVIGRSCKIINIRRLQIPLQRAMIVDRSADTFVASLMVFARESTVSACPSLAKRL